MPTWTDYITPEKYSSLKKEKEASMVINACVPCTLWEMEVEEAKVQD